MAQDQCVPGRDPRCLQAHRHGDGGREGPRVGRPRTPADHQRQGRLASRARAYLRLARPACARGPATLASSRWLLAAFAPRGTATGPAARSGSGQLNSISTSTFSSSTSTSTSARTLPGTCSLTVPGPKGISASLPLVNARASCDSQAAASVRLIVVSYSILTSDILIPPRQDGG